MKFNLSTTQLKLLTLNAAHEGYNGEPQYMKRRCLVLAMYISYRLWKQPWVGVEFFKRAVGGPVCWCCVLCRETLMLVLSAGRVFTPAAVIHSRVKLLPTQPTTRCSNGWASRDASDASSKHWSHSNSLWPCCVTNSEVRPSFVLARMMGLMRYFTGKSFGDGRLRNVRSLSRTTQHDTHAVIRNAAFDR